MSCRNGATSLPLEKTPQGFTIDGEIEEGEEYREQLIFVEGGRNTWQQQQQQQQQRLARFSLKNNRSADETMVLQ